ncbi:MAG: restriction endonuclease subunit S [Clostridia bacterium]|nr:restriction endonuclease subunit S [Clostridia bacterium]
MIDTQAIRNKILDLALRGKLTEQLPEDGTAEELYQQIQQEKQALEKAGKIKKTKPLPSLTKDDVSFDVPDNWIWVKLGNIISLVSGTDFPKEDYNDSGTGMPYMTGASNIENDHLIINRWTTKPQNIAYKGDLLLVCKGSGFGKIVICDVAEAHIARQFMAIRVFHGADIHYIKALMAHSFDAIKEAGKGLIPGVDRDTVLNISIPLPPLPEQHRIVERINDCFSILDTIDALQTQYHDNLTILKSKLIDAGIQGKLTEQLSEDGTAEELYQQIQQEKQTLEKAGKIKKSKPLPPVSDEEKPFDIPENWKWVRIASLGTTTTGGTPSKDHPEYYGGNYPFFKPSDLDRGHHITKASEYLTEFGKEASRQLPKGSLLVCCIGSIGKCAIIDIDGTANQQINALAPIMCDSDYLLYAIDNDAFKYQLNQGSRATTVSIINKNKFDNCIIPLPPLAEQKRIVDKLEELLPLCKG